MRILTFVILISFSLYAHAENSVVHFFSSFFSSPTYFEENINSDIFPKDRASMGKNMFVFDPNHLMWAVYNKHGMKVGAGKASGGKDYCPDIDKPCRTVEGAFSVFRKEDEDCTSKTFPIDEGGGAPMPHCMFFHEGYAIHGSDNVPKKNISHGCIRVTKKAAEWINSNYINIGSTVVVLPYDQRKSIV